MSIARAKAAEASSKGAGRIELLDALVGCIGDIDIAGGVECYTFRTVQLAVGGTRAADAGDDCASGIEFLHAVGKISDVDVSAGIKRQRGWFRKLRYARSAAAKCTGEAAVVPEPRNAIVDCLGNKYVARGFDCNRDWFVQFARSSDVIVTEPADRCCAGIELLDNIAKRIGYKDVA